MPSTETLLVVVIVATAVNLVLGLVLLLAPRVHRRGGARSEVDGAPVRPSARGAAGSASVGQSARAGHDNGRSPAGVFGPAAGAVASDPQTGLDAPATWNRWLREEDARVRRYRRPATVVLIELDGLERLVERLGPAGADRLIPPVAATMRRHARESDRVARLGPARFGAILPETDEVRAINYVERVRSACDLWLTSGAVSLRLSIGWAETNATRAIGLAVAAAEERLNDERRRALPVEAVPEPGPARVTRPSPAA